MIWLRGGTHGGLLSVIKYQTTLLKITCLYFVTSEVSTEVVWPSIKILFICPTKDPFTCARNIKVQGWNLREQRQQAIVELQAYTRALDWSPGLVATASRDLTQPFRQQSPTGKTSIVTSRQSGHSWRGSLLPAQINSVFKKWRQVTKRWLQLITERLRSDWPFWSMITIFLSSYYKGFHIKNRKEGQEGLRAQCPLAEAQTNS